MLGTRSIYCRATDASGGKRISMRSHALTAVLILVGSQGYAADDGRIARELDGLGFAELATQRFHLHFEVQESWVSVNLVHFEDAHADVTRWARKIGFEAGNERPIQVVLFKSREHFAKFADRIGLSCGDVAGFYAVDEDLLLFAWNEFAPAMQVVIRHEVAHAVLYRLGVHRRDMRNPPWLVEGLACIFEVDQKEGSAGLSPNPWRFADMSPLFQPQRCGTRIVSVNRQTLQDLVGRTWPLDEGEGPHQRHYAQAYALAYYLCETNPEGMKRYLAASNSRPADIALTPAVARSEFSAAFGPLEWEFIRGWLGFTQPLLPDDTPP